MEAIDRDFTRTVIDWLLRLAEAGRPVTMRIGDVIEVRVRPVKI